MKLFAELALRGENLGSVTAHFLRILDRFGGARLERAARQAFERGTPHPRSVQMLLEKEDMERKEGPRLEVDLPDDPRVRGLAVRPHDLGSYDRLSGAPAMDVDDSTGDGGGVDTVDHFDATGDLDATPEGTDGE